MPGASRAVEIEWQFALRDVDAFARWLGDTVFGGGWTIVPSGVRSLRDVYLDSDDRGLARAGYALRIRRSGTRVEATLKAFGRKRRGRAERREITERLDDARTASLPAARGAVGTRVRRLCGGVGLRRLFAVRTRRRMYDVRRDARVLGELALDQTTITAPNGRQRSLRRLEVEVVAGRPAMLAAFVASLRRRRHLEGARRSKFETGLALARVGSLD